MLEFYILMASWLLVHAIRHGRDPSIHTGRTAFVFLLIGIGFPFLLMTVAPGPSLAAVMLAIVFPIWRNRNPGALRFGWNAAGIIMTAYLITALMNIGTWHQLIELRKQHPLISISSRVPELPKADLPPISRESEENLKAIEGSFHMYSRRNSFLSGLHNNIVRLFISSPGFGVSRSPAYLPGSAELNGYMNVGTQPEKDRTIPIKDEWRGIPATLFEMHVRNDEDFVDPEKMGYFKDRDHVTGFLPHTQSYAGDLQGPARLDSVLLVGLLNHPEPVVYMSDNLPSLLNSRSTPTRPLDAFEISALAKLKAGAETARNEGVTLSRAMGALRNAAPCMTCHGGVRGQLLGAFSYRFSTRPK